MAEGAGKRLLREIAKEQRRYEEAVAAQEAARKAEQAKDDKK